MRFSFAALAALLLSLPAAAGEPLLPPVSHVAAFVGGARRDAIFRDDHFQNVVSDCAAKYPFQAYMEDVPRRVADCMETYMKSHGATAQAVSFMRFTPTPTQISELRTYGPVAVAHVSHLDTWVAIGRSGDLLQVWSEVDVSGDSRFATLHQPDQDLALSHDGLTWPSASRLQSGGERLVFEYRVESCLSCPAVGRAAIAYDFDRTGIFTGVCVLSVTKSESNH